LGIGFEKKGGHRRFAKIFSTIAFLSAAGRLFWHPVPGKAMKVFLLCAVVAVLFFAAGCRKEAPAKNLSTPPIADSGFVKYIIPKGEHYATSNNYKAVDAAALKFVVRFDSSCIYQTANRANQSDINKLYGFSDNGALHQQYSARFGWRWSEGALRLFAYTYNNGVRAAKELGVVPIGKEVNCAIEVTKEAYVFSLDKKRETMPRLSTTASAKGYQLYPYFGGDEAAPHEVRIWIKDPAP
jgi:hypothetical protein